MERYRSHRGAKLLTTLLVLAVSCNVFAQSNRAMPQRLGVHHNSSGAAADSQPRFGVQPSGTSLGFGRVDFPRAASGTAYGLNKKGDVVGVYGPEPPAGYFASFGYWLKGKTFHDLDYPGAALSGPLGINDKRQIVGYYDPAGDGNFHAYLYANSKFTSIDYPGSTGGAALAINDAGAITGTYYDASNQQHGFMLTKGVYTTIDPPGSGSTEPLAINSAGTIVGDYYDAAAQLHGFIYQNGQYTTVDYPGSPDTILSGINDAGQIVGGYGADKVVGGSDWRTPNMFLLDSGQFTPLSVPVDNAQVTIPYAFRGNTFVGFYSDSLGNLYGYEADFGEPAR